MNKPRQLREASRSYGAMMALGQRRWAKGLWAKLRSSGSGPLQPTLARRMELCTRDLHPPIIDQECRGQPAGER